MRTAPKSTLRFAPEFFRFTASRRSVPRTTGNTPVIVVVRVFSENLICWRGASVYASVFSTLALDVEEAVEEAAGARQGLVRSTGRGSVLQAQSPIEQSPSRLLNRPNSASERLGTAFVVYQLARSSRAVFHWSALCTWCWTLGAGICSTVEISAMWDRTGWVRPGRLVPLVLGLGLS